MLLTRDQLSLHSDESDQLLAGQLLWCRHQKIPPNKKTVKPAQTQSTCRQTCQAPEPTATHTPT